MFEDIAHENKVVARKFFNQDAGIAPVDGVVEITMHRGDVGRVSFNAIDTHAPVLALVACRVFLRGMDVRVFAEEVAPFAKTYADVKDRSGLKLTGQVNDGRNGVGPAAGHGVLRSRIQTEHQQSFV